MNIVIDPEFQALIPPLTPEEYADLTDNLLRDGCRDPLSLWGDVLIDGHNRHELCTKHGIAFKTVQIDGLESRDDAKLWIGCNQLGRRNLSGFQRAELALMMKPIEEAKAKERQARKPADSVVQNSSQQKTRDTIADLAGVSHDTIRKVEAIKESATPEIIQAARTGALSVNLAAQVAELPDEAQQAVSDAPTEDIREVAREVVRAHVSNNSGNNEWYTPPNYINAAREVMGGIDTDPASSAIANRTVGAAQYFDAESDGLKQQWSGRVWMNPPYAQPLIADFCDALCEKAKTREIEQACVLVNNATETVWFQTLLETASAVCFIKSRIKFLDPEGKPGGAPLQGQAVLYIGDEIEKFADSFCSFGKVLTHV